MRAINVIILYGLPCSGKSSLLRELDGYRTLSIDDLIRRKKKDPEIADFIDLSQDLVGELFALILQEQDSDVAVEMGCLVPKEAITLFEKMLREKGLNYRNIVLTASDDELIRRIKARNRDIETGKTNSIKVSGPDYLTRFVTVFDANQPDSAIYIDTTEDAVSSKEVAQALKQA